MATVNYTLRLDETDKRAAEEVFNQLGLTLSAGLTVYLKTVARQQKIPFELSLHENTTPEISVTDKKIRNGKKQSFKAIKGILAGYEVDLDKEREERISAE